MSTRSHLDSAEALHGAEAEASTPPLESGPRSSELPNGRPSGGPFEALRSDPPPNAEGLTAKDIDIVFQPIVSVTSRRTFAYEALTRCRWPSLANPETLFRRASEE